MRFWFKVAPGVKVRISPRSVGLGFGPRAARYHVSSSGWRGVSSGAGGFQTYHTLSGARRQRRGDPAPRGDGELGGLTAAQVQRAEVHLAVADRIGRLLDAAEDTFVVAGPPALEPPPPVSATEVQRELEQQAVDGIAWFRWSDRRNARRQAQKAVAEEIRRRQQQREDAHRRDVAAAAAWWDRMQAADPAVVMPALDEAMADNPLEAVTVDVTDGHASLLMIVPDEAELLGEREPATTDAGYPTTRKMSQTRRNELYLAALSANLMATAVEAAAVAPALQAVTVVAVRRGSDDDGPVAALQADLDRLFPASTRVPGATRAVNQEDMAAAEDLGLLRLEVNPVGRTRRLASLADPELTALTSAATESGVDEERAWPTEVPPAPGQVLLLDPGSALAEVVTVLRNHAGLALSEAKRLVDGPMPTLVIEGYPSAEAAALARDLDAAGATVAVG